MRQFSYDFEKETDGETNNLIMPHNMRRKLPV